MARIKPIGVPPLGVGSAGAATAVAAGAGVAFGAGSAVGPAVAVGFAGAAGVGCGFTVGTAVGVTGAGFGVGLGVATAVGVAADGLTATLPRSRSTRTLYAPAPSLTSKATRAELSAGITTVCVLSTVPSSHKFAT